MLICPKSFNSFINILIAALCLRVISFHSICGIMYKMSYNEKIKARAKALMIIKFRKIPLKRSAGRVPQIHLFRVIISCTNPTQNRNSIYASSNEIRCIKI